MFCLGGLCLGGSLSRGFSVQEGLCPGGSLSRGLCSGGLYPGGLCPRGSLSRRGLCHGETPYGGRTGGTHPTGMHSCFSLQKDSATMACHNLQCHSHSSTGITGRSYISQLHIVSSCETLVWEET